MKIGFCFYFCFSINSDSTIKSKNQLKMYAHHMDEFNCTFFVIEIFIGHAMHGFLFSNENPLCLQ